MGLGDREDTFDDGQAAACLRFSPEQREWLRARWKDRDEEAELREHRAEVRGKAWRDVLKCAPRLRGEVQRRAVAGLERWYWQGGSELEPWWDAIVRDEVQRARDLFHRHRRPASRVVCRPRPPWRLRAQRRHRVTRRRRSSTRAGPDRPRPRPAPAPSRRWPPRRGAR